jgi:hypothetical protein
MARRDFIDPFTAELRVGRRNWKAISVCVTRYVMPEGAEFFDWLEIKRLIESTARAEPPLIRRRHPRSTEAAS